MNVLALVFSLLLILSYGVYASFEKHKGTVRLKNLYVRQETLNRKMLNQYASELYRRAPGKAKISKKRKEPRRSDFKSVEKKIFANPDCAKINLWKLIYTGKENEPLVYELSAKLIRTFYSSLFPQKKGFEYEILDAILEASFTFLSEKKSLFFEKLSLKDPLLERVYYKMLKGTHEWEKGSSVGYPPLLEWIKADLSSEPLCLFHAHLDLVRVLFGKELGQILYREIHKKQGSPLTRELIERLSAESNHLRIDPHLFDLIQLGRANHPQPKGTLVVEERGFVKRQPVSFKE